MLTPQHSSEGPGCPSSAVLYRSSGGMYLPNQSQGVTLFQPHFQSLPQHHTLAGLPAQRFNQIASLHAVNLIRYDASTPIVTDSKPLFYSNVKSETSCLPWHMWNDGDTESESLIITALCYWEFLTDAICDNRPTGRIEGLPHRRQSLSVESL